MQEKLMKARPEIFEYTCFRLFLRDLLVFTKSEKPFFSYRYFSQKAGFTSPNFLKLVIDGKRNLSHPSIEKFVKGFSLSLSEADFFNQLVLFNQADKPLERARFAENISRTLGKRKIHHLQKSEFNYYSKWFNIALRELVATKSFREDPEWIAQQFHPMLSASDVGKSLRDLEALGLLSRTSDGKLVPNESSLNTENEVASSMISLYHKKMLQLAGESIDRTPREWRELSAICIPISLSKAQDIKERIQKFREEILLLAKEDDQREAVYQLNLQLFPLTKIKGTT